MSTMLTLTPNNTLCDASFPSYFNGAEETTFVLPKSRQNSVINKSDYGEIDVFSAERYFNEPLEEKELTPKNMSNKDYPHEAESLKQKIRPRTPSVHSESSWNSRSLLLNVQTPQQPPKGNSGSRKSFLSSLGCRCSCNGGNAIDVSNRSNQGKSWKLAKNGDIRQDKGEFVRKISVEVFRSPLQAQRDNPSSLEREVKILAWDAVPPRGLEIGIPKCPNGEFNDTDSESSSDLFEIEGFSTNHTNPYLVRQASDVMSGCITPTTCYAPSEASVQWSTVTASMGDFSVMSDSEELEPIPARTSRSRKVRDERNTQWSRQMTNKLPGILSGCKSHKAVKVAEEVYRTTDKAYSDLQRQQGMQNIKPLRKFQTESNLTGRNTTNHRIFNTLPHSESQFKRAPHMLYMH